VTVHVPGWMMHCLRGAHRPQPALRGWLAMIVGPKRIVIRSG
jgi:hypothetical protein